MSDNNIETRVGTLETKVGTIEAKMDAFIQSNEDFKREMRETMKDFKTEMRETMTDFKTEMRQQNEMRANEIADIRNDIKNISREVHNLFLMAAIGIGGLFATLIYTILKNG